MLMLTDVPGAAPFSVDLIRGRDKGTPRERESERGESERERRERGQHTMCRYQQLMPLIAFVGSLFSHFA